MEESLIYKRNYNEIFKNKEDIMKVIFTLKAGNKAAENFCRDMEMTPQEYERLKDICRAINSKAGEECASAYIHQI